MGARASLGYLQALPYSDDFLTLQFPDSEQKVATRLGAADRVVLFEPPQVGPFGQAVQQLTLRHHQLPASVPDDAAAEAIVPLPNGAGFEFSLGATRYRYSRFGLERLKVDDAAATA